MQDIDKDGKTSEEHQRPGSSYQQSPEADFDTDSVASSASSIGYADPVAKSGVSPLNRKRTVRLSHSKGEETMDAATSLPTALLTRVSTTYFLRSQLANTKINSQTENLSRMETIGKWNRYREPPLKSTDTVVVPQGKGTANQTEPTAAPGNSKKKGSIYPMKYHYVKVEIHV